MHYKKISNKHHMNHRNISKLIGLRSHMIKDSRSFTKIPTKEEQEVYPTYLMKQTMNNLILWTIQNSFLDLTSSCMHGTVEYTCNEEYDHRISGLVSSDVANVLLILITHGIILNSVLG